MHVDPPEIPLIESKKNYKWDKDCVKIKVCRDLMSQKSDLYEFKMALFDNGEPEELLLFIRNFNMTLKASGTLVAIASIQYLRTLVRLEALNQFGMMSAEVGCTTLEKPKNIILGLGTYFLPVNDL